MKGPSNDRLTLSPQLAPNTSPMSNMEIRREFLPSLFTVAQAVEPQPGMLVSLIPRSTELSSLTSADVGNQLRTWQILIPISTQNSR